MEQGIKCWNEDAVRGMGRRRSGRIAGAGLLAALCAGTLIAGQFADPADGKKKKKFDVVGRYQGTNEDGGTVSSRLTRKGTILGFTLTNAILQCMTQPNSESDSYTKTVTITHGPMRMQGKSKKWPQGKKFEVDDPLPRDTVGHGGLFTGKLVDLTETPDGGVVLRGKGMKGEVAYGISNGPTPPNADHWPPGTEACDTGLRRIDWKAKKPGTPGFVYDPHPPQVAR
jgi:hypothetical protein